MNSRNFVAKWNLGRAAFSVAGIAISLAMTVLTSACRDDAGTPPPREDVLEALNEHIRAKVHPALQGRPRLHLVETMADMMLVNVAPARPGANVESFRRVFGGTSMSNVALFLNDRIKYILPQGLVTGASAADQSLGGGMVVGATNVGVPIYLQSVIARARGMNPVIRIRAGSREDQIEITSPRVGLVELGVGFGMETRFPVRTEDGRTALLAHTWVRRSSTLVHEARHSDCRVGVTAAEAEAVFRGETQPRPDCGYPHGTCPATISLPDGTIVPNSAAGVEGACDRIPWGSYGVQLAYLKHLALDGRGLTERQRAEALTEFADTLMRVENGISLLRGDFGWPDMSSI
ncbi:MAG: hypothetical protein IT285_15470 [Bdellovibrionales bacterium]|nr:hypothetical protein [Bdellovibrionales bacterium]